jgi:hypothetical protein
MQPFASLDLTEQYIRHNVTLYAHDHPTQPDGINAAVKALETALKAFELPPRDWGLSGDGTGVLAAGAAHSSFAVGSAPFGYYMILARIGNVHEGSGSFLQVVRGGNIDFEYGLGGAGADPETFVKIGANTYYSGLAWMNALWLAPQTVGVLIGNNSVQFFENGWLGTPVAVTWAAPTAGDVEIRLGNGLNGTLYTLAAWEWSANWGNAIPMTAIPGFRGWDSLAHAPMMYFDLTDHADTITDKYAVIRGWTPNSLAVINGVWTPWDIV